MPSGPDTNPVVYSTSFSTNSKIYRYSTVLYFCFVKKTYTCIRLSKLKLKLIRIAMLSKRMKLFFNRKTIVSLNYLSIKTTLASTIHVLIMYICMIFESSIKFDGFNSFYFLFLFLDVTVRCQHNGYTYNVGETTPSQDGCNECTCRQNGNMECTKNICSNGELIFLILS